MGRLLLLVTIVAAILVPTGLSADPVPGDFKNAAKYCKALRTAKGVDAFQAKFGTNTNKRNAFGKCVSATAKAKAKAAKADDDDDDDDRAESAAEAKCKAERTANAAKFEQDYKNFGQCVKAAKGASHAKSAKTKGAKADDDEDDDD